MSIEHINIGNIANDGTGDELRVAFRKINQNFEEFDIRFSDTVDGISAGGGAKVFKGKSGNDLEFRSITAGTNIAVTENQDSIEISAPNTLIATPVITDSGSFTLTAGSSLRVFGGLDVNTRLDVQDNSIVIESTKLSRLSEDPSPVLSGSLDAQSNNIVNANQVRGEQFIGGSFFGTLFGSIAGVDIDEIVAFFNNLDFGSIDFNVSSFYDFLTLQVAVDYGTITAPAPFNTDFGSLV